MNTKAYNQLRRAYWILMDAELSCAAGDVEQHLKTAIVREFLDQGKPVDDAVKLDDVPVKKYEYSYRNNVGVVNYGVTPTREEVEIALRPYDNSQTYLPSGKLEAVKRHKNRTGHSLLESKLIIEQAMGEGVYNFK